MSITKQILKVQEIKKISSTLLMCGHPFNSIIAFVLSHTPQSRHGPVSRLDRNGPLTWSPGEIGTAGVTASKGRRPARVPRTSTATAVATASSCRTSSVPCPTVFGLPHSSALVSTRILLLLRNRTGSVCAVATGVETLISHGSPSPSRRLMRRRPRCLVRASGVYL